MRLAGWLTLIVLLFAGCAATEEVDEAEQSPKSQRTSEIGNTGSGAADGKDANLTFRFNITADEPVRGFAMRIPEEANGQFAFSPRNYVQVAVDGEAPEAVGVFFFESGSGALIDGVVFSEGSCQISTTVNLFSSRFTCPMPSSTFQSYWWPGRGGQTLGVVVAGTGLTSTTSVYVDFHDRLEFGGLPLTAIQSKPIDDPAPIGNGTGWSHGLFVELHQGAFWIGLDSIRYMSGQVEFEELLPTWVPPYGGVQSSSIRAEAPTKSGYSLASVDFYAGDGLHHWDYAVDASGVAFADAGAGTHLLGLGQFYVGALGWAQGMAFGDGAGGATASLDLTGASANWQYQAIVSTVSFDAPLAKLLNITAPPAAGGTPGIVSVAEDRVVSGSGIQWALPRFA